jgi:hypothetical protein
LLESLLEARDAGDEKSAMEVAAHGIEGPELDDDLSEVARGAPLVAALEASQVRDSTLSPPAVPADFNSFSPYTVRIASTIPSGTDIVLDGITANGTFAAPSRLPKMVIACAVS